MTIPRDLFKLWLQDPDLLELLDDMDIGTSNKTELFDVLDCDLSGELEVPEFEACIPERQAMRLGVISKLLKECENILEQENKKRIMPRHLLMAAVISETIHPFIAAEKFNFS